MLPIASLVLSGETQIRVAIDKETVLRYATLMISEEGRTKFPPIIVYRDKNGELWIADGHHRITAAIRCNLTEILAEIREGTKADAIWAAAEINSKNALQLKDNDIRKAITMLLEAWPDRSLRSIAEAVGCSKSYVGKVKDQVSTGGHLNEEPNLQPAMTIGKDGKSYPTRKTRPKGQKSPTSTSKEIEPIATEAETKKVESPPIPVESTDGDAHPDSPIERYLLLRDLYPDMVPKKLSEDIVAAFSKDTGFLYVLSISLCREVMKHRKGKERLGAEKILVDFINTQFTDASGKLRVKILRTILSRLLGSDESIDKVFKLIDQEMEKEELENATN